MAAILIGSPASEPLSLAEAKNYLRVQHERDDTMPEGIAELLAPYRVVSL